MTNTIHEEAVRQMEEYVGMGHFKEPLRMFPPLVEGFEFGAKWMEKKLQAELSEAKEKMQKLQDRIDDLACTERLNINTANVKEGE